MLEMFDYDVGVRPRGHEGLWEEKEDTPGVETREEDPYGAFSRMSLDPEDSEPTREGGGRSQVSQTCWEGKTALCPTREDRAS